MCGGAGVCACTYYNVFNPNIYAEMVYFIPTEHDTILGLTSRPTIGYIMAVLVRS